MRFSIANTCDVHEEQLLSGLVVFSMSLWTVCAVSSALEVTIDSSSRLIQYEALRHVALLTISASFVIYYQPPASLLLIGALSAYTVVQGGMLVALHWSGSHKGDVVLLDSPDSPDSPKNKAWTTWYQNKHKVQPDVTSAVHRAPHSVSGLDQA